MPAPVYAKQEIVIAHNVSNSTGSTVWHQIVPDLPNRVRKVKGIKGMCAFTYGNASASAALTAGYMCWLRVPTEVGVPGVTDFPIDDRRLWVPMPYVAANGAPLYMATPYLKAVDVSDTDTLFFGVYVGQRQGSSTPLFLASFEWAEARELKA